MVAAGAVQSLQRLLAAAANRPDLRAQPAAGTARDVELAHLAEGDSLPRPALGAGESARVHLAAALGAAAAAARTGIRRCVASKISRAMGAAPFDPPPPCSTTTATA